jgi:hypothetical protein
VCRKLRTAHGVCLLRFGREAMLEREVDERWILVFDSIHHVLAAERALLDQAVWCDLIPTPREVSSDCGMALEMRPADWPVAEVVARSLARPPVGVYRHTAGGYEPVRRPDEECG